MNPNLKQILQNITKNLSIASIGLGVFNTITNQTTIKSLRENLELEKEKNLKLINDVNKLLADNTNNVESILNKNIEINGVNNNKLEILNNKINNIIENKSLNENSISEVNNSIKDINKDLVEIIDKINESLNNNFLGTDIWKIINEISSYYNNLNYFQSLALTHLSAIVFIFLSLISLISLYFGNYLIDKYFNKEKYPRIYKFILLRRKFQTFYLIKDLTIIFLTLIALAYINIMLFITFTL